MTARPGAYPQTTKVLAIVSLIGTFVAMEYKRLYGRPRPSELCPALLPPIAVPGHASFPSGHSTQAHLMALCLMDVLQVPPVPHLRPSRRSRPTLDVGGPYRAQPRDRGAALPERFRGRGRVRHEHPHAAREPSLTLYAAALAGAKREWV